VSSPMYIAEVSPARIRGRMVSVNQFAIIFGMVVVYFVNYFIALQGDEAWNVAVGWRWMFGSGALPSLLLLVLMFFVPATPRWLVKLGRRDEAFALLERIDGKAKAQHVLAEIDDTVSRESGSVWQLFQPGMRIALLIGVVLAVLQQVTGINVFLYYAPEIIKKLGVATDVALLQTVLVGAVNMVFTVIAIWTVDRIGRKPLLMLGASGMGLCLLVLGWMSYIQRVEAWALLLILGYIACFALSVGPVVWVVLSEIFPTKIRGRAMSIAAFCLWNANFVVSQTFPMMDADPVLVEKFHHAFPFWVYGGLCAVTVVFVWLFVPETKGKSLEEIERMWQRRG